ncbi:MAG: hypothetical protein AAF411_26240 [Myxococcota bacterium]
MEHGRAIVVLIALAGCGYIELDAAVDPVRSDVDVQDGEAERPADRGLEDLAADPAPSETSVDASDSRVDTALDAPLGIGPFSAPQEIAGLGDGTDDDPTLSQDLREIYFKRRVSGEARLFVARRTNVGDPFDPPEELRLLGNEEITSPELAPSGLVLHFTASSGGRNRVFRCQRASPSDAWGPAELLAEIRPAGDSFGFSVSQGERFAVYTALRPRDGLEAAERSAVGQAWAPSNALERLNETGTETDVHVAADGLVVYFSRNVPGELDNEIFRASRSSVDQPFGDEEPVPELGANGTDTDPWVSADGRAIVFASRRNGPFRLYAATRSGARF